MPHKHRQIPPQPQPALRAAQPVSMETHQTESDQGSSRSVLPRDANVCNPQSRQPAALGKTTPPAQSHPSCARRTEQQLPPHQSREAHKELSGCVSVRTNTPPEAAAWKDVPHSPKTWLRPPLQPFAAAVVTKDYEQKPLLSLQNPWASEKAQIATGRWLCFCFFCPMLRI